MSRIRSIKPEFFRSLDVAGLSHFEQLLWIGLWTEADDHGRLIDDPRLIKAALFPLDNDVHLKHITDGLEALALRGRVHRYAVDGRTYIAVTNWHDHQAINRPGKPKHPAPPVPVGDPSGLCPDCSGSTHAPLRESSVKTHGGLTEVSVKAHGGLTSGREQGREQGGDARAGASSDVTSAPLPITEPPLKCPKHRNDDTSPPCGACADARKAHDVWDRVQAEAVKSRPTPTPATPRCPIHPEHEAGSKACPACEADRPKETPNLRVLRAASVAGA